MARFIECAGSGDAPATSPVEELATLAVGVWLGVAVQFSPDGSFDRGEPGISTSWPPRYLQSAAVVSLRGPSARSVVLERRLCCGEAFTVHSLDQRPSLFFTMSVLPCQIPHSVPVQSEPVSVSAPCGSGSFSKYAGSSNPLESGVRSCRLYNGLDGLHGEPQPAGVLELVAALAGLVHRCNHTAPKRRT